MSRGNLTIEFAMVPFSITRYVNPACFAAIAVDKPAGPAPTITKSIKGDEGSRRDNVGSFAICEINQSPENLGLEMPLIKHSDSTVVDCVLILRTLICRCGATDDADAGGPGGRSNPPGPLSR